MSTTNFAKLRSANLNAAEPVIPATLIAMTKSALHFELDSTEEAVTTPFAMLEKEGGRLDGVGRAIGGFARKAVGVAKQEANKLPKAQRATAGERAAASPAVRKERELLQSAKPEGGAAKLPDTLKPSPEMTAPVPETLKPSPAMAGAGAGGLKPSPEMVAGLENEPGLLRSVADRFKALSPTTQRNLKIGGGVAGGIGSLGVSHHMGYSSGHEKGKSQGYDAGSALGANAVLQNQAGDPGVLGRLLQVFTGTQQGPDAQAIQRYLANQKENTLAGILRS